MADDKIILYDCPSRFGTGTCWSPNVWKTRLLLNYKRIPYETKWIHGPDIMPLFWSFGIQPHKPGTALNPYTIPAIKLSQKYGGSYIMKSSAIAQKLEELYPSPSLHLDHPIHARVQKLWTKVLISLSPVLVPRMPRECLSGPTIGYHQNARKATYGMTLEEYESKFGGEKAWKKAQPHLEELSKVVREDESGPFCLGKEVSYADFLIVGFLEWCRCLGGDCLSRVFEVDGAFESLYEACREWLERNDR